MKINTGHKELFIHSVAAKTDVCGIFIFRLLHFHLRMALRKLAAPLASLTLNWISAWRSSVNMVQPASFVPKARVCLTLRPEQQYSKRRTFSEEELLLRSAFLASQFHGHESEMHHFLSRNQQLVTMGKEKFHRVTELLAQHGITKKELFVYPEIYRRKYETLASRIRQLEEGGVKPVTLRMINTTYNKYKLKYGRLILDVEALEEYNSSIQLFSLCLGLTESEAEAIINESLWLKNTKLSTLKEKIELLWSYGISSEAIRERIWVLAFPSSTITSRLDSLKQSGLQFQDFPKSYLSAITSSDEKFKKFQERLLEEKAILQESGCSSKPDYICFRLSCSKAELDLMRRKFRAILSIRLPKLKSSLDIMLNEFGLAPSLIIDCPRALRLSTETLRERLQQLKDLEVPVVGSVLNLTNRDYEHFVSQLKNRTQM